MFNRPTLPNAVGAVEHRSKNQRQRRVAGGRRPGRGGATGNPSRLRRRRHGALTRRVRDHAHARPRPRAGGRLPVHRGHPRPRPESRWRGVRACGAGNVVARRSAAGRRRGPDAAGTALLHVLELRRLRQGVAGGGARLRPRIACPRAGPSSRPRSSTGCPRRCGRRKPSSTAPAACTPRRCSTRAATCCACARTSAGTTPWTS